MRERKGAQNVGGEAQCVKENILGKAMEEKEKLRFSDKKADQLMASVWLWPLSYSLGGCLMRVLHS